MDKKTAEEKILKKLFEINKIYKEYNPDGNHISMFILNERAAIHDFPPKNSDKERIDVFSCIESHGE